MLEIEVSGEHSLKIFLHFQQNTHFISVVHLYFKNLTNKLLKKTFILG